MKILFGSQNFGFDIEGSDKDYVQIVYPTVSDLCLPIPKSKEDKQEDGSIIKSIDIRKLPDLALKSNLDFIQLLYSTEVVCDKGDPLRVYLETNKEKISSINIPRLYKSVVGNVNSRMNKGNTKDLVHCLFSLDLLIQFHDNVLSGIGSIFESSRDGFYRDLRNREGVEMYYDLLNMVEGALYVVEGLKEDYLAVPVNYEYSRQMLEDIGNIVLTNIKG